MNQVKEITKENFSRIQNSEKPVIIMFAGEWCPDCNAVIPYFQQLENMFSEKILFGRAHVGKKKEYWPEKLGFKYIPTFIIYKGGETIAKYEGEDDFGKIEQELKEL